MRVINLLELASQPGGVLEGFQQSRWVAPPATLQRLIEATGGSYNPQDVFHGAGFEDLLVYHPQRKLWALCADWQIAIVEADP